jgi:hypothetical protein
MKTMKDKLRKNIITMIALAVGIVGGFLYWKFIGCASGTCPLTSSWIIMLIYGGILGALLGNFVQGFMKKTKVIDR